MNGYKIVKLSDISQVESGGTPDSSNPSYWNGDIPWVTLVDVKNKYVESTSRNISAAGLSNSSAKILPIGTVLFSSRATIGNVSIAKVKLATNQGFKNFICDRDKIIPEYLYYFLRNEAKRIEASCPGTTYKEISKSKIEKYAIPLPPIEVQRSIVESLDQTEALRQKRKQAIELLDDYLKSVFLEMFGDPVKNPKGWKRMSGSDYSELVTVGVVIKPASHYTDRGVIALRSLNIKRNSIDLSNLVYFSKEAHNGVLSKSKLRNGDVVVVRTGLTGMAAVVPEELDDINCIDLIIIRPRKHIINPFYFCFLLNSDRGKHLVSSKEVGGIQKHFNIGALKKLDIPIPPINLQNKFAGIVQQTETIKHKMLVQSEDLECQFQALMQKAFLGELQYYGTRRDS